MSMHDVIIVGAGPAGSYCARLLGKEGLDVAVLERKPEIGVPVQCSGLISRNLDRFIKVPMDCIEHEVKGALIHGPGGLDIKLRKPSTAAYVLDRSRLDRFLASIVKSRIHLETGVRGIKVTESSVRVSTNKGDFEARAIIGAVNLLSLPAGETCDFSMTELLPLMAGLFLSVVILVACNA